MRILIGILLAVSCYAQTQENGLLTGTLNASAARFIPPTATFASLPSSPPTGAVYIFTDAITLGTCTGGGSARATCRWNGAAYEATSGGSPGGITSLTGDVTGAGTGAVATTLATVNGNTGTCGDATHVGQVTLDAKGRATACSPVVITGTGGITALTGDGTAAGSGAVALTLATVNGNVGACGDATHVGQVTLDAKGRATACSAVSITGVGITALTGDGTASGTGSAALTLATVNGNVGTCGDATHVGRVTLDAKGRATACSAVSITAGVGDVVADTLTTATAIPKIGGTAKHLTESGLLIDGSNNLTVPGTITQGSGCPSCAGYLEFGQGTAPSAGTTSVKLYGAASITSYLMKLPSVAATGFYLGTNTAGNVVMSQVGSEGNGSKVQLFTGSDPATNDCAKFDANHNVVGAGGPCGSGGSDTAVFTGGAQVQRLMQCSIGTVPYTSLTTAAASQEITILTSVTGNARFGTVIVNPSTAFTGGGATAPTVSMGRTGSNSFEMTGTLVPIGAGSTMWPAQPSPPQLSSTYSIVLAFAVGTGNVNTFTAGSLDWSVCAYADR